VPESSGSATAGPLRCLLPGMVDGRTAWQGQVNSHGSSARSGGESQRRGRCHLHHLLSLRVALCVASPAQRRKKLRHTLRDAHPCSDVADRHVRTGSERGGCLLCPAGAPSAPATPLEPPAPSSGWPIREPNDGRSQPETTCCSRSAAYSARLRGSTRTRAVPASAPPAAVGTTPQLRIMPPMMPPRAPPPADSGAVCWAM
jgi:hypothetical protein